MRFMMLRGSLLFDAILLLVLLGLMYAFMQQHHKFTDSQIPNTLSIAPEQLNLEVMDKYGHKRHPASDTSQLIDSRIKNIKDLRARHCQKLIYSLKEKASLVIDFNDYQFYDLKNTIQSILNQNYDQLLEEIIVIDDGSTLDYIRQDVEKYLKTVPKARLVQFATQQGTLKARIAAMREVKTDIVVFLEVNVICNRGWLEPLIDLLIKDHNVIALPHYDRIHSPVTLEYQLTQDDLLAMPAWNFGIKMRPSKDAPKDPEKFTHYYPSPAMRGSAFALRKSFLDSIGSFDGHFEEGGGDILELSLRAWLCGGMIETVTCSRVGILNLDDQGKPYSQKNCQRIAGLWYGNLREVALRLAGLPTAIPDAEEAHITTRLRYITSLKECRDISWYMESIAKESLVPTQNAVKFGTMAVMSGRCARLANDSKINLIDCNEVQQSRSINEIFEFTTGGQLKIQDRCLTTENTAYIMAQKCRKDDRQQLWTYKGMELRNVWSNFCATHVTDPGAARHNRQIIMAQSCEVPPDHKAFNQWQFQTG